MSRAADSGGARRGIRVPPPAFIWGVFTDDGRLWRTTLIEQTAEHWRAAGMNVVRYARGQEDS